MKITLFIEQHMSVCHDLSYFRNMNCLKFVLWYRHWAEMSDGSWWQYPKGWNWSIIYPMLKCCPCGVRILLGTMLASPQLYKRHSLSCTKPTIMQFKAIVFITALFAVGSVKAQSSACVSIYRSHCKDMTRWSVLAVENLRFWAPGLRRRFELVPARGVLDVLHSKLRFFLRTSHCSLWAIGGLLSLFIDHFMMDK
jgi:hypothetical protein